MRSLLLFVGMMLIVPTALGIGRSGNGTISSSVAGFEAETPKYFEQAQNLSEERLRLMSFIVESSQFGFRQPFLELTDIGQSLPGLVSLGRQALPLKMTELGWEKQAQSDPCVDAYLQSTDSTLVLAMFWGVGKGVVAVGPQSPNVKQAMESFRASLVLEKGACAW